MGTTTLGEFFYDRIDRKRGEYPRGHKVRCKHCGWSYEDHHRPRPELLTNARAVRKGCAVSIVKCTGYEPGNLQRWHQFEKRKQKEEHENFLQEVYERRAQGEAAWGMYAAQMRVQNFNRDRAELEEKVATARNRNEQERKDAEGNLAKFLRDAHRQAGTIYIGSGAGSSNPDDFD